MSLSCYKVVMNTRCLCDAAKMYSAICENQAVFCHMAEMLSWGAEVMLLLWNGQSVEIIIENLCFLSYIGEMFTSPSQSNVMVVGRKVLVVLEKECHLGQLEEMCLHVTTKMVFQPHGRNALLVLQKKCYFGHMVQMCSRVTNEMLRAPHDCTLSSS